MATSSLSPTAPLSEADIELLSTVYYTRTKFLFSVVSGLGLLLLWTFREHVVSILLGEGDEVVAAFIILVSGFFFLIGTWLYLKKVYPYRKDVQCGLKEVVTYTIVDKLYFDTTDEYFVCFDDPDYMHYEVEHELYHSCFVGDIISIHKALHSGHVFEKDDRFTLL